MTELPLVPADGSVAADVAAEFPGLRLQYVTVAQRRRPSPPALVAHLRGLSNRYRGADVVAMRTKSVPHAFRAFFRQIGLDPDVRRIPSEEAAVSRLLHGEFRSADLISDACLVAVIETGVPVWALDADLVDAGGLGIRTATGPASGAREDAPGPPPGSLIVAAGGPAPGSLVVADGSSVHAELFADPIPGHGVGARTRRVMLFSVAVDGVPAIHLDEALWCALNALGAGG
jgi:DNA/RNA-binding domain of Phe-tRNA-synthetase-like protein